MDKLRDFLVKVGFVTCVFVVAIWCLNLAFARDELHCVSEIGWLGLATKYSDRVEVSSYSPEGKLVQTTTMSVSAKMACAAIFGKGWHNVQSR